MSASHVQNRVGPWRLERLCGSGAFGRLWHAVGPGGQPAVVKLLPTVPGAEIRALARVCHPAVVRPLGSGGLPTPYVAMDVASGAELPESALAPEVVERVIGALADALAACHRAGVSHGDVKPANVMFDARTGRVTLVDFGLAGAAGGTPAYAAPERFGGGVASAAADVYALGVVAVVLYDGAAPARSERSAVLPRTAPAWVREVVTAMLAEDPALRPTAGDVADVFAAHGVPLPEPTVEDLRSRAAVARVARPAVDHAVEEWLENGGRSAFLGPPGSGRSHALAGAAIELQARGRAFVTLRASPVPWASVEEALRSTALPGIPVALPDGADRDARAEAAAEALVARADAGVEEAAGDAAVVLVDDYDLLDRDTRATVQALARLGVRMLLTASPPPDGGAAFPFPARCTTLPALRAADTVALLEAILGPVPAELATLAHGSVPADVVAWVLGAARAGHLQWRRGAWVADLDALADWKPTDEGLGGADWSDAERRLAAVVAVAQPVSRGAALRWADADLDALRSLLDRGVVAPGEVLSTASPPLVGPLRGLLPREVARRMLEEWVARDPVPWNRLGPLLVACADPTLARSHGPNAVRTLSTFAPEEAAALADALVALGSTPPLEAARVTALARGGRLAEVREAGEEYLRRSAAAPEDVEVLLAIASAVEQGTEDASLMLRLVERAAAVAGAADERRVRHARAHALWRAGRYAEADDVCASLDEGVSGPGGAREVLTLRSLWAQVRAARDGNPRGGLALLAQVPKALGQGTPERAVLESITGRLLWHLGSCREAAHAFEAAAASRRSLPTVERARLDNNAGLAWHSTGDVTRAVETWERALAAFERVGATIEAARVGVNLCQGYRELGKWARAEEVGHPAVTAAEAAGLDDLVAIGLGNLGDNALWRRQWNLAESRYDAAEAVARRKELWGEIVELARRRVELAWFRRSPDFGERMAAALALARQHAATVEEARLLAIRAAARGAASDPDGVATDGDQAEALVRHLGLAGELAMVRLWVAEGWLSAGRGDRAADRAEPALLFATEMNRVPLRTWADRILSRARPIADPARDRLERLTELAVRVSRHDTLPDLLGELVSAAIELIRADRALVVGAEGSAVRVLARAARPGVFADDPPSMSIIRQVLSTRREVVIDDVEERGDLRRADSVVSMALRSIYCVPMVSGATPEVAGVLYLDGRQPTGATPDTLALLRALAAHASVAVRKARNHAEMVAQARHLRDVAHDLRNPLNTIQLVADAAAEEGVPLGPVEITYVRDSARAALELVAQTLAAEPEEPIVFDLNRSLVEWSNGVAPQARAARVDLTLDVEGRRMVRARRGELRRVFTNLVTNALRHAASGRVRVTSLSDGRHHGFQVHDSGPGFPPDALDRVFDRGFTAHGGTGLGLAIVREIVLRHQGDVVASNPAEGGALIRVSLPAHRAEPEANAS